MGRASLICVLLMPLWGCVGLAGLAPERTADKDPGGSVPLRVAEIAAYEARDVEKRVSGQCLSACTMYLGLSTACFEPNAVLGFHGPRLATGGAMSERQFEATTALMARYYPPRVATWFMAEARHGRAMIRVPASELIARGEARACPPA